MGVVYLQGGIAPSGIRLLPTQLMESAFLLILCVFLLVILHKKITGLAVGCYLTLYGIWRFAIEFFRDDNRGSILFFSTSQFISIFIIAIGLAIIVSATKSVKSAFKK
ncbi:MAG: prolipoprotein diacylglyceryl transferase family protein [Lachnospiraceae bacterium]